MDKKVQGVTPLSESDISYAMLHNKLDYLLWEEAHVILLLLLTFVDSFPFFQKNLLLKKITCHGNAFNVTYSINHSLFLNIDRFFFCWHQSTFDAFEIEQKKRNDCVINKLRLVISVF